MDFSTQQNLFLGTFTDCYLGYSTDLSIREHSASGGVISQLIIFLLKTKQIEGAMLCRFKIIDKKISHEVKIITNPDEIADFASSVYFDIPLLDYISDIKRFNGRIAFVGLPCHIRALRKIMARDHSLAVKIVLFVGLFCGHNNRKNLLVEFLNKKGIQENDVYQLFFRKGHWRGNMEIILNNGETKSFPASHFKLYYHLFCDSLKKCLHCYDHAAEEADLSCGDAWLTYLKQDPIKHSIIIARNANSNSILHVLRRKGDLFLMQIEPEIVFKSQKRSIIFHKAIEARSKIGRLFGYSISVPSQYKNKARWNDYLSALMMLITFHFFSHKSMRKMFLSAPKILIYPWLLVFKFLTNF